jgi:hypothetical protein
MDEIPVALGGALTVALIVVLGVFVYPALLGRPGGRWIVAAATALLTALFVVFDRASGLSTRPAVAVAFAIALAPVITGVIVARLQRKTPG